MTCGWVLAYGYIPLFVQLIPNHTPSSKAYYQRCSAFNWAAKATHYGIKHASANSANGLCNEEAQLFLATGVTLVQTNHEPAEVMEVHQREIAEVLGLAQANEISDGPSALATLLADGQLRAILG